MKDCCDTNPVFMTTAEKEAVLLELPGLQARLAELNLRVMACADDVAAAHGARNVGDYIAHQTHQNHATLARDLATARELDTRWPLLRSALCEGRVNLTQTIEITRALNAFPNDLDADTASRAEALLVEHAEHFTPSELRRMGKRLIDVIAPEIAEALEGQRLADEERSARERQQLTLRPQGDGTTRITGLLTDLTANRLATALNAITNPRRDHLAPAPCGCTTNDNEKNSNTSCGDLECPGHDQHQPLTQAEPATADTNPLRKLSTPQRNARALNTLLETLDPKRLPLHGGDATTVIVTIDYETLKNEIGTATISAQRDAWPDRISAGEARRLACNAGILPAVLNGEASPSTSGEPEDSTAQPNEEPSASTTPTASPKTAEYPQPGVKVTIKTPGQKAARPTSTRPNSSAADTTTTSTTPPTKQNASPTASSDSPDGHEPKPAGACLRRLQIEPWLTRH